MTVNMFGFVFGFFFLRYVFVRVLIVCLFTFKVLQFRTFPTNISSPVPFLLTSSRLSLDKVVFLPNLTVFDSLC